MDKKDYYQILELTEEDKKLDGEKFKKKVKSNYRKLSLKYHPDRNSDKSEEERKRLEDKFKDCVEAYEVLSDPQKRQQYDMFGSIDGNNGFYDTANEFNDFMSNFMGGFNPFGRNHTTRPKGKDIQLNVTVTLEEIYNLSTKEITYKKDCKCPECNGSGVSKNGYVENCKHCHGHGFIDNTQRRGNAILTQRTTCPYCMGTGKHIVNPCSRCGGTGLERTECKMTLNIPLGVTNKSYIKQEGNGNETSEINGVNGDLYIIFNIAPHKDFDVSDKYPYNIISLQEIPILDCLTGGIFDIKCLDGNTYQYKIEPNTEQGTILAVKNKGLRKTNGEYGDLHIIIKHKFPTEPLTEETINLINQLKEKLA